MDFHPKWPDQDGVSSMVPQHLALLVEPCHCGRRWMALTQRNDDHRSRNLGWLWCFCVFKFGDGDLSDVWNAKKYETAGAAGSARVNSWFEENPSPSPEMKGPALWWVCFLGCWTRPRCSSWYFFFGAECVLTLRCLGWWNAGIYNDVLNLFKLLVGFILPSLWLVRYKSRVTARPCLRLLSFAFRGGEAIGWLGDFRDFRFLVPFLLFFFTIFFTDYWMVLMSLVKKSGIVSMFRRWIPQFLDRLLPWMGSAREEHEDLRRRDVSENWWWDHLPQNGHRRWRSIIFGDSHIEDQSPW